MTPTATLTPTSTSTVVPLDVEDIDALEVCNAETGDSAECFEIGPLHGGLYLRIRSADNIVLAAKLERLLDDLRTFTDEERAAKALADSMECPGCRTRIAPDDLSCGAPRCYRTAVEESQL